MGPRLNRLPGRLSGDEEMRVSNPTCLHPRYPSTRTSAYVIGVLVLVTTCALLDRQLPTLVARPIRETFGVSNIMVGILQGYAFLLFYAVMAVPFGWLIDRKSRRNLLIGGVFLWSAMTMLSGFINNFWYLLVARVAVGIGESVLAPAALSMIADYVEPRRRGRAIGAYYLAIPIGTGASLLLGGVVLHLLPSEGAVLIPHIGLFLPWQVLFIVAGLPGLILVPLLLSVKEPGRLELPGFIAGSIAARASFGDTLRYVREHPRVFANLLGNLALISFSSSCVLPWAPTYFLYSDGVPLATSGMGIGVAGAVGGLGGTLLGGFLSDSWVAAGVKGTRFRVLNIGWLLALPAVLLWPVTGHPVLGFALVGLAIGSAALGLGACFTAILDVVPNRMRGQIVAVNVLTASLAGVGLAPVAVAALAGHLFTDDTGLGYAAIILGTPAVLLGFVLVCNGLDAYEHLRQSIVKAAT
jgi:MFS family permease